MNPRTKRWLLAAEVLILAVLALWVLYPRSLNQVMGRDFDREEILQVQATLANMDMDTGGIREVFLTPDDPAYEELMTLLDGQTYRFPGLASRSREITLDHTVRLTFAQNAAHWEYSFTGADDIQIGDRTFHARDGEAFQQEVLDLLLAQPYTVS